MISQRKSKQVRIDSWLLKLLSRDMKTKTKKKINQQTITKYNRKIKNNKNIKAMGNITPTIDHYPRN